MLDAIKNTNSYSDILIANKSSDSSSLLGQIYKLFGPAHTPLVVIVLGQPPSRFLFPKIKHSGRL